MSPRFFVALLEDENGSIQQAVSVMILLPLDGDVSNPFVLNDYYQTKLDDFTNGTRFPLT
jgi:hypothetical protein